MMSRRNVDECFYGDSWEEDNFGIPNGSNMKLLFGLWVF